MYQKRSHTENENDNTTTLTKRLCVKNGYEHIKDGTTTKLKITVISFAEHIKLFCESDDPITKIAKLIEIHSAERVLINLPHNKLHNLAFISMLLCTSPSILRHIHSHHENMRKIINFCINKIKFNINFFYKINELIQKYIIFNSTIDNMRSYAHLIELEKISPCVINELLTKYNFKHLRRNEQTRSINDTLLIKQLQNHSQLSNIVKYIVFNSSKNDKYIPSVINLFMILMICEPVRQDIEFFDVQKENIENILSSYWFDFNNITTQINKKYFTNITRLFVLKRFYTDNEETMTLYERARITKWLRDELPIVAYPTICLPNKYKIIDSNIDEIRAYIKRIKNKEQYCNIFSNARVWTVAELNSIDYKIFADYFSTIKLRLDSDINDFIGINFTSRRIISICKLNPFLYNTLSDEMKQIPKLFMQILPYEFSKFGPEIQNNEDLCIYVIKKNPKQYASMNLEMQKKVFSIVMEKNCSQFRNSHQEIFDSKEHSFIAALASQHNITYSSYRHDPEFVLKIAHEYKNKYSLNINCARFKQLTKYVKYPSRRIVKFSHENNASFSKHIKLHPRLHDIGYVMDVEKRIYTMILCIDKSEIMRHMQSVLCIVFQNFGLMEYLN